MPYLYFMRHGQAESVFGKADEARELTDVGHQQAAAAGRLLGAVRHKPAVLLCSPRTRAIQTAEHISAALDLPHTVSEAVNFSFDTEAVREAMAQHPSKNLMFVGHQPTMSQVIGEITGARVIVETASVACVHVDFGVVRGELTWFAPPSVAALIG